MSRDTSGLPETADRRGNGRWGSLAESLRTLQALARDLSDIPGELREAPTRAAARHAPGMPGQRGRLRRAIRSALWPVTVLAVSGAAAAFMVLLTDL
ncbi:hypothetical protein [Miltoncostaea marina]|uniref:hypothetical protein n=1 Tax=Miltoncostaea marina TaxID=2843215 RepID=UPI001C3CCA22|nr:hypothetical protein [Miltoncostaea marina]